MSRFDLYFVVCDESNDESDLHLSDFIINLHRKKDNALEQKCTPKAIRNYISVCKKLKPRITVEAGELLRKYYMELRHKDKVTVNNSYRVTVRQL
jgi:DNA replication licensing factor MCM5